MEREGSCGSDREDPLGDCYNLETRICLCVRGRLGELWCE